MDVIDLKYILKHP